MTGQQSGSGRHFQHGYLQLDLIFFPIKLERQCRAPGIAAGDHNLTVRDLCRNIHFLIGRDHFVDQIFISVAVKNLAVTALNGDLCTVGAVIAVFHNVYLHRLLRKCYLGHVRIYGHRISTVKHRIAIPVDTGYGHYRLPNLHGMIAAVCGHLKHTAVITAIM